MSSKMPKKFSAAILQSCGAGLVPRLGIERITVGRKDEIEALLNDIEVVSEGGASLRLIVGRYGSGKTFLSQLLRTYALQRNYVVADADLSPSRRFTGSKNQGLNLYRELLNKLATRTRPEGNAFSAILERWIDDVKTSVIQEKNIRPADPQFSDEVQKKIFGIVNNMRELVHGFDFSTVLSEYWKDIQSEDDKTKDLAIGWLRGEISSKMEAKQALGIRVVINNANWYDYLKILARFVKDVGYSGLLIFIDEMVNLYRVNHPTSRQNNYEYFLSILNDVLQGKAQHIGFFFGCTPESVEDPKRGLFSYEAIRTRLDRSRFMQEGIKDYLGPILMLNQLTPEEIFVLLQRLREIHGMHYGYEPQISDEQIHKFMEEVLRRLGVDQFLTPREMVKDFISILNILHQNSDLSIESFITKDDFKPTESLEHSIICLCCGYRVDTEIEVCPNCGIKIAEGTFNTKDTTFCSKCGAETKTNAKFCSVCGNYFN